MEKREYLIILYDFYSELLSDKQKEHFEDYYFNNLSLGEISENENVVEMLFIKVTKSDKINYRFMEEGRYIKLTSQKILLAVLEDEKLEDVKIYLQNTDDNQI